MKAIQIKYLPTTEYLGNRLKAFTDAGSITVGRDYEYEAREQAIRLAFHYCHEYNWPCGQVAFSQLPNGDYVMIIQVEDGLK